MFQHRELHVQVFSVYLRFSYVTIAGKHRRP
jgi:hypothetical protein